MLVEPESDRVGLVERFHRFCVQATARLQFGLNSVVAPTFLGFVLINGFTFVVDLVILTALHSGVGAPLPLAVTRTRWGPPASGSLRFRPRSLEERSTR